MKQQLTALASAWWAPLSINNKRIINQQLLFRTLQTLQTVYTTKRIAIRFRLRFTFSFRLSFSSICLKMSKNALRWQDGKMASENSKSRIRGRAGRNVRRLVFPARPPTCESLQKRHFKLHPTPSFRHLIAQHPLTPIDPYRSSDRKRATVALLSFHCFAWLSLLCLFLVSLNCRRLLSRRFKLQLYFTLLSDRF